VQVLAPGLTQTLAWASSSYLIPAWRSADTTPHSQRSCACTQRHVACSVARVYPPHNQGGPVNKRFGLAFVSVLALGSIAASAADTAEERSELRQRAEAYQSERARNPDFQPGEGRLAPEQRSEAPPKRQKAQAQSGSKKRARRAATQTTRDKAKKTVTSLKKIPGAFVRK
jgi:hypothetical protein